MNRSRRKQPPFHLIGLTTTLLVALLCFVLLMNSSRVSAAPLLQGATGFSGQLDTCDGTYNRLTTTTSLSAVGTNVFYEFQQFTVSTTGAYTLGMTSSTFSDADGHATIYRNAFSPGSPVANALYVDDDGGPAGPANFLPQFTNISLSAGEAYILVSAPFENGITGSYTWTVLAGAGTVSLGANNITLGCTATATYTPTNTHTPTDTPTNTNTPNGTPSATATHTETNTATATWTDTATNTATFTPSATATNTETNTATATWTDTATNTATLTPSSTATNTETNTATATWTDTATNTATLTPSSTASNTPDATETNTATNTVPPPPSYTPSATATYTPTDGVTATSTTPPISTATATATNTPDVPPSGVPCEVPLPVGSVQGRMIASQFAFYDPNLDATSTVFVSGGTSWWIIDSAPGFYRIWIACQAPPVWVSAELMTPNYDSVWNGQALP